MKPSKYTFFTSLLCASGLSAGLCFCVMTSFAVPADGLSLVCACVLAALLFSALLLLPKSWIWLLAMAALAGGGFICCAHSLSIARLHLFLPLRSNTQRRSRVCRPSI